ncbi:transmembrane protein, putative [Medicago truncatula]|uniref:Transmembrane protein, putative n=1 Tax=Medicago truncatula TaxID=3880 RepID=A0A072V1X9_MEDTR|nr:transmembrane protein, putative [Medicago truncatula]
MPSFLASGVVLFLPGLRSSYCWDIEAWTPSLCHRRMPVYELGSVPIQTGVVVCVLLLGFIFLLVCIWVTACFLARWFGDVVFGGDDVWW